MGRLYQHLQSLPESAACGVANPLSRTKESVKRSGQLFVDDRRLPVGVSELSVGDSDQLLVIESSDQLTATQQQRPIFKRGQRLFETRPRISARRLRCAEPT
jgi:hypothetical protein